MAHICLGKKMLSQVCTTYWSHACGLVIPNSGEEPGHEPSLTCQSPLELPGESEVSQDCCPWALCDCNIVAVFKTEPFLCFPVPDNARQGGRLINVVELSCKDTLGWWQ